MDTLQQIVHNFAVVVGLNHLRIHSLYYLGEMRFDTLRTRVTKVDHKLSRQNVMSLYTLWLQSRAFYVEFSALPIKEWCSNLAELRCSGQGVMDTWGDSLHDPQYYHGALTHKDTALLRRVYNSIKDYYDKKGGKRPQQTGGSGGSSRSSTANPPPPPLDNSGFFKQTTASVTGESSQSLPSKQRGTQAADLGHPTGTPSVEPRTLEHSEAPKPLENGMCRRCRATGHAISDCPTRDDPSWDPPPHPRYICNICGEYGSHYVWDCQFHQSNSSGEQKNWKDEHAIAAQPRHFAPAVVHPAEALRNYIPSSRILSAGDDDLCRPIGTTKADPVVFPRCADWPSSAPVSRSWASVESERSYQLGGSVREPGRLSPWEEEDKRGALDGEKKVEKRSRSERDEVAHHQADDFLTRLGHALKRNLGTKAPPDDLICVDYDPVAKRPRLDLEEGEVVDESNLPSLIASVTASDRGSKDESSLAEPQSGSSYTVEVSAETVGQIGRCPTALEQSPSQQWEHTTQEARKTAMELWQNSRDIIEPHSKFDKEAQLFADEVQTDDEFIDHSTVARGRETVVFDGDGVDAKVDKKVTPSDPPFTGEGCGGSNDSGQSIQYTGDDGGQSLADKSRQADDIATYVAKVKLERDGGNDRAVKENMEALGCRWLRWFGGSVSPEAESREAKGT
ncbi:Acyl-CoA N-acyltransferase [Pochonia chlamydosporia 170]|uniref:Acyl-CoA N-acyltransferase n=1 Tax=Pochonia chlamydosporia 170 TaxID=1380566 RepID=A0A179FU17_METCM|nr:Acyl-CoA N-acyltransferase [Pochonia chlamydosporia 170]OAQ69135.1 Acyl-CoA N-acyltransferase [Pochonia chlamydosporia 170]